MEDKSKEVVIVNDTEKKKKKGRKKYAIYISLILGATILSLFLTLKGHEHDISLAFANVDGWWIFAIILVMIFGVFIDGLIITIFMRLYTTKYYVNQGAAVSMIGTFYSGITPGSKGGQLMQAHTLKKQGSQISNAASILVMYFILYHFALIIFDVITVISKSDLVANLNAQGHIGKWSFTLPLWPLTITGFIINIMVIGLFLVMSYSHRLHTFIMHYGVGFLARLRFIKEPDRMRESLRIQVDNFKIELRRLLSNIPVTILITFLFFVGLICKFSIPWFAGMALNAYDATSAGGANFKSFIDACFMSGYHQMITGLFPIPGGAGVSELFFSSLFNTYYAGTINYTSSVLLIWRSATYYLMVAAAGLVTAFYKASPKEKALEMDRKEFVTMQLETLSERQNVSNGIYVTNNISRQELHGLLKGILNQDKTIRHKEVKKKDAFKLDDSDLNEASPFVVDEDIIPSKPNKKHTLTNDTKWRDFGIK